MTARDRLAAALAPQLLAALEQLVDVSRRDDAPMERLLNARELGALLGVRSGTVLDWWEAGDLPGFRLSSGAVRFRWSEIEAWLEQRRCGPTTPPARRLEEVT